MKSLSITFSAGIFGALVNSFFLLMLSSLGITALMTLSINPTFSPPWLYARLVWGGIFGLLFFWNYSRGTLSIKSAAIISILPTLVQLFVVFPYKAHKGMGGMDLGTLMPALVIVVNFVWGLATYLFLKLAGK